MLLPIVTGPYLKNWDTNGLSISAAYCSWYDHGIQFDSNTKIRPEHVLCISNFKPYLFMEQFLADIADITSFSTAKDGS